MWLDPGLTTGWARFRSGTPQQFTSGQWPFVETGRFVREWAEGGRPRFLGWERFDITPHTYRMKGSSWALEVTGMVRWLCADHGVVILPAASREARKIATPKMLKYLGWYHAGAVHANDAASHLLAWCIRTGNISDWMSDRIRYSLEGPDSDAIR